jgi:hypothetical protein
MIQVSRSRTTLLENAAGGGLLLGGASSEGRWLVEGREPLMAIGQHVPAVGLNITNLGRNKLP